MLKLILSLFQLESFIKDLQVLHSLQSSTVLFSWKFSSADPNQRQLCSTPQYKHLSQGPNNSAHKITL